MDSLTGLSKIIHCEVMYLNFGSLGKDHGVCHIQLFFLIELTGHLVVRNVPSLNGGWSHFSGKG